LTSIRLVFERFLNTDVGFAFSSKHRGFDSDFAQPTQDYSVHAVQYIAYLIFYGQYNIAFSHSTIDLIVNALSAIKIF